MPADKQIALKSTPDFVLDSSQYTYQVIVWIFVLLVAVCIGLAAVGGIVFALAVGVVGAIVMGATLYRTNKRRSETGKATLRETIVTIVAYSSVATAALVLLAGAGFVAIYVMCIFA